MKPLSPQLRNALFVTGAINFIIGALFLFAPESDIALWPSPISPVLTRFIGAIILGNAVGAWIIGRTGTWAEARALFYVGLVYGIVVLVSVIPQLLLVDADRSLWIYVVLTAPFTVVLAVIIRRYERSGPG